MTRFFDILFSLLALIVLTPFMIPIMIGLKLTGEHDIFYRQERIGRYGKPFMLIKFATMKRNSPNLPGGLFTSEDDPRILPMGRFLRKTKVNELPQLLNILKGDMSVIGYRPTVMKSYQKFPLSVREKISYTRPGLSGIGSVVFRDEEKILQNMKNKEEFNDRVIVPYKGELEVWYTNHRSVINYFKLILLTIDSVFNPTSHRWKTSFDDLPSVPNELTQYI